MRGRYNKEFEIKGVITKGGKFVVEIGRYEEKERERDDFIILYDSHNNGYIFLLK